MDIRHWIDSLEPILSPHLGPLPKFEAQEIVKPSQGLAPWSVKISRGKVYFIYYPAEINYFFISPTPENAPHPNPEGRLVFDLVHDLVHIYQANYLIFLKQSRFFHDPKFGLWFEGAANWAAFEILCHLWPSLVWANFKRNGTLSQLDRLSLMMKYRYYKRQLGYQLLWEIKYSFRYARFKGIFLGWPKEFPPIGFLPAGLKEAAIKKLVGTEIKEPNPKFAYYDFGIYWGAALRQIVSLREMIFVPPEWSDELLSLVIK